MLKQLFKIVCSRKQWILGFCSYLGVRLASYSIKRIIEIRKKKNQIGQHLYVGIELGGTNFSVAVSKPVLSLKGQLIDFEIINKRDGFTSDKPNETIQEILDFINHNYSEKNFEFYFIGVSSFGPLCLNKNQNNYGTITTTPKQAWKNIPILTEIKDKVRCRRIQIDTDVNAAAYAQFMLGRHQVKQSLAYITVGTGVGVGLISHGLPVHGLNHPEGGHIIVKRNPNQSSQFDGVCKCHRNCVEGFVCNIAIAKRKGISKYQLHTIEDSDRIWRLIGYYLAQLCLNLTLTCSPEVIIIGGGIMNRKILYDIICQQFITLLNQYLKHQKFTQQHIKQYIKAPVLGANVGTKGAMMLDFMIQN